MQEAHPLAKEEGGVEAAFERREIKGGNLHLEQLQEASFTLYSKCTATP